jgi:hypothetical protein
MESLCKLLARREGFKSLLEVIDYLLRKTEKKGEETHWSG